MSAEEAMFAAVPADAGERQRQIAAAVPLLTAGGDADGGRAAATVLAKLAGNVLGAPDEPKYRRVRLTNPRIAAAVEGRPRRCGCSDSSASSSTRRRRDGDDDACFVAMADAAAHDEATLLCAHKALDALLRGDAAAIAGAAPPPPRLAPAPIGPVDVKVIRASDERANKVDALPDDFYEVSGAEAKAAVAAAAAKREADSTLKTSATREAEAARRRRRYRKAIVRVRFPDGTMLQGTFGARATVAHVLGWVSDGREPGGEFELAPQRGAPLRDATLDLEAAALRARRRPQLRRRRPRGVPAALSHRRAVGDARVVEAEALPEGVAAEAPRPPPSQWRRRRRSRSAAGVERAFALHGEVVGGGERAPEARIIRRDRGGR